MANAKLFLPLFGRVIKTFEKQTRFTSTILQSNRLYSKMSSENEVYYGGERSTIYALSSGHGKCGVAVIRISGSKAAETLLQVTKTKDLPSKRMAICRTIYDPITGHKLDKGLVLWFAGPYSFTGEDSCELHVHGGPAVIMSVLTALGSLPGVQQAEAGQFTKRAFLNGKLDLVEVEGLADLIHAETEAQQKQALRQMDGELSQLYTRWRKRLVKCTANVEAYIDFGEDENIEDNILSEVEAEVGKLQNELENHLLDKRRGERLRDGVRVAIVGKPNVGKSSLLNKLCQRPAAIVSPIPGTTRDVIETALNIGGYPIVVSDTAGLRVTEDLVEKEGVSRAIQRVEQADLTIFMVDASSISSIESESHKILENLQNEFSNELKQITNDTNMTRNNDVKVMFVLNKTDLLPPNVDLLNIEKHPDICAISCLEGHGIETLVNKLAEKTRDICGNPLAGNPSLTQARHRECVTACSQYLTQFLGKQHSDVDIAAYELHKAVREIGKVTGKVTSEEILDVIFTDFCIGK